MGHIYRPSIPTTLQTSSDRFLQCCVIPLSSSSSVWFSSPIWSPYKEPNIVKLKNTPVLVDVMKSMLPAKVVIATINVLNLMTAAMMSTRNVSEESGMPKKDVEDMP